jgi:hypothetical protein
MVNIYEAGIKLIHTDLQIKKIGMGK